MKHNLIPLANQLEFWLKKLNAIEPPPPEIIGYNFGLFELENGYSIYLIGAKKYSKYDDDWACNEDYSPKERYLKIPIEYDFEDYNDALITIKRTIEAVLSDGTMDETFIKKAEYITIGFDDSDLLEVEIGPQQITTIK